MKCTKIPILTISGDLYYYSNIYRSSWEETPSTICTPWPTSRCQGSQTRPRYGRSTGRPRWRQWRVSFYSVLIPVRKYLSVFWNNFAINIGTAVVPQQQHVALLYENESQSLLTPDKNFKNPVHFGEIFFFTNQRRNQKEFIYKNFTFFN